MSQTIDSRSNDPLHLAFMIARYGRGGVERMMLNTAVGLARRGHRVDYLAPARGAYLDGLEAGIRLHPLPDRAKDRQKFLRDYLNQISPRCLVVAKDRDLDLALSVRRRTGSSVRIVMRPGTTLSARLAGQPWFRRWLSHYRTARRHIQADAVVANAEAVRQDVAAIMGRPEADIFLVPNPVITPAMLAQADMPPTHHWLCEPGPPVILGVGNLHRVKDFATLIRALALVRAQQPARLILLGDGHLREELLSLARDLGVAEAVDLPGFVENPYPFLRAAQVFVLSSLREGSPNALTEALALGTPVVATDCPGGHREILGREDIGALVPVQCPHTMAQAILTTLHSPPAAARLRDAVAAYTQDNTALAYEALLRRVCDAGVSR
ncbi:glycosyltransferase [Ectothiorhodospira magna]|nr:glycosyltransferase [Ectothiorhodospira magna]